MEYVYLVGTEDVQRAASTIRNAADQMQMSASAMQDALFQHERFLDDWLIRFAEVMKGGLGSALPPTAPGEHP